MKNLFVRFVREEKGQDLIEYALLAALIALVGTVTAGAVGDAIALKFTAIAAKLQ